MIAHNFPSLKVNIDQYFYASKNLYAFIFFFYKNSKHIYTVLFDFLRNYLRPLPKKKKFKKVTRLIWNNIILIILVLGHLKKHLFTGFV